MLSDQDRADILVLLRYLSDTPDDSLEDEILSILRALKELLEQRMESIRRHGPIE